MAGTKMLVDGRIKFSILSTKPADPSAPTATELAAGTDVSCLVLFDNFNWTFAASDTVNERPLCSTTNGSTPGAGNLNLGFQFWRWLDSTTGQPDATTDTLFALLKAKGTTLYGYTRRGPLASVAWAASDIFDCGAEFVTDSLQDPGGSGFIKYTAACLPQQGWEHGTVAAGS